MTSLRANRGEWAVPASFAQERIWFASQLVGDSPVYHVLDEYRLEHPVEFSTLLAAMQQLSRRHEALRTSFRVTDGVLSQVIHDDPPIDAGEIDLRSRPEPASSRPGPRAESDRARQIDQIMSELVRQPLPLEAPPLWRVRFVRTDDSGWLMLLVAHHAVIDALSMMNLRAELDQICLAARQGRPATLAELPIQYADYSVWQRERLGGGERDRLMSFWRATLADLPSGAGIRTDHPRPAERSFAGADLLVAVPERTQTAVSELARANTATPFMVMFAAYAALLHALSDRTDIVVGVPVAGRDRPELARLVGMFVNMVVVRVDASGDPTFTELLARTRAATLAAFDHQEMPFQLLVHALATRRELGVAPLYQVAFNHVISNRLASAEDELNLEVLGELLRVEYSTALFEAQSIRELAQAYLDLVAAAVAAPQSRLSVLVGPARAITARLSVAPSAPSPSTGGGPTAAAGYQPPTGPAQELVARVFAQVLGLERIGATDDFFDLGGHSLLALRVIARIGAAAGVELALLDFFNDTTVAAVAAEVERLLATQVAALTDEQAGLLLTEGAS